MSNLTTLSPAENLLVRDGNKVSVRLMLKGTLIDLLMRGVLAINVIEAQPHKREKARRYKYIVRGPSWHAHEYTAHEEVFLAPYRRDDQVRHQLKNLVAVALERAGGRTKFCRIIRQTPELAPLYRPFLSQYTITGLLNSSGRVAREVLVAEIAKVEEEVLLALNVDRPNAVRMINELRGNIVLLKQVSSDMLKELDEELKSHRLDPTRGDADGSGGGCGGWHHGSLSEGFDSAAEAAGCGGSGCGSDGGSGCGSDGGSGCGGSGCSGCGGCGGD